MDKGFPADAHDAGHWAVDWEKGFQLLLMMLAAGRWIGKQAFQLMLMMLAAGRWIGKRGSSANAHDAGSTLRDPGVRS